MTGTIFCSPSVVLIAIACTYVRVAADGSFASGAQMAVPGRASSLLVEVSGAPVASTGGYLTAEFDCSSSAGVFVAPIVTGVCGVRANHLCCVCFFFLAVPTVEQNRALFSRCSRIRAVYVLI